MVNMIVASRRFQRDYQSYLRKYGDLESIFREFLDFRVTARPDQSFSSKDGRMVDSKFRRCHLVHGKAILIYQLYASELRLVAIEEHNAFENGSHAPIRRYAKSLVPSDYYQFDVNNPFPVKPTEPEPNMSEEPVREREIEIDTDPEPILEPPANPLQDAKFVEYLRNQQLLYEPRPARPVVAFQLDKEIIAPKNDWLLFDFVEGRVHHLSPNEFDARFRNYPKHKATNLGDAVMTIMSTPEPVTATPEPKPKPAPRPESTPTGSRTTRRKNNVGPQLGRLIVTMGFLGNNKRDAKFDSGTINQYLLERDRKSMSAVLVNAQNAGLIKKAGSRTSGHGYLYALTASGERTFRSLGDWPFSVAGLTMPFGRQARR